MHVLIQLIIISFSTGFIQNMNLVKWISSYLHNRTRQVSTEDSILSKLWALKYGASQGSVLKPIFHLIYYPLNPKMWLPCHYVKHF